MKKSVDFRWGPEQQDAFKTLRKRLYEAPLLTLSESGEDFVIFCDALITVLGAVLMQWGRFIVYTSRQLKPLEVRYLTHDLELGDLMPS